MGYKLEKIDYELIKKYKDLGYEYVLVDSCGTIYFSNYPIASRELATLHLDDITLLGCLKNNVDYNLDEIIENITNVK